MSDHPKVSIVMPVYNGGTYFELALQSALAQTYENVEIVIVNDGSTDGGVTDAVARRYAERHPDKIRYFHQSNTGVAGALNKAVEELTGDFFCWLSHDDLYAPEKTAVQVAFWQRLGRPDAMLISNYTLIDSDGKQFANVQFDHEQFKRSPMVPLFRGAVNGCTVFIPIGLLRAIRGPFDLSRRFTQDFQLWRQLIRQTDFFHVPQSLVHYRVHPSQDSQRPDIAEEGETLWRAMIDGTTEIERAQMYGSSWRFYEETRKILAPTTYVSTVRHLEEQRDRCSSKTLVSVVMPFYNEIGLVRRALESILAQTYPHLDVVLVDDGSTEAMDDLLRDVGSDARVQLFHIPNGGPGAARNFGLSRCQGDYVAFLDADDLFLPNKIEVQLRAMMQQGAVASHTSYLVVDEGVAGASVIESGLASGRIYPRIISNCPIATPTVMLHRLVVAEGFVFADAALAEDVVAWVDLSVRHDILGLNEVLTVVERDAGTASRHVNKSMDGLQNLLRRFGNDPVHGRQVEQLRALEDGVRYLRSLKAAGMEHLPLGTASEAQRLSHQKVLIASHEQLTARGVKTAHEMLHWANALNPTIDTLVALGISNTARGQPQRAIEVFDQAVALAPEGVPAPLLHVRAIAKCHLGRFADALVDMQGAWDRQPHSESISYGLASLKAYLGRLNEAERLFSKPLTVPLDNGSTTSTVTLRFDEPDAASCDAFDRFYNRKVDLDRADLSACHAACEVVFCFCCDVTYFHTFAAAVLASIQRNAGVTAGLHIHIINPSEEIAAPLAQLRAQAGIPLSVSTETVDLSAFDETQRKTYYACARFLALPDIMRAIGRPFLLTDADQLVVRPVGDLLEAMRGADAGLLVFPQAALNILSLVSASVVFVGRGPVAASFFGRIARYLASLLARPDRAQWHLDQAALAVAYVAKGNAKVRTFAPDVMHSKLYDGEQIGLGGSTFWSVTYSIPENRNKINSTMFSDFRAMIK
ncbi:MULTISPECIES: glycosyltransferase [Methylorubrum]|uniref:glycosyltransferase n=1 Tax=Methylorubrum TaxID=2282523 RepID=UPI00209F5D9F|nr:MULTISPECIES: glycosyltransferase [Methylorubrum]MCP1549714.1 glycosyltransferase involved in cell wall biosynthesis [Methylorubrum zatmanii]MCP1553672.1 glycosyltransferase involved in cell wall biosynthesis [Methylorubrum extorquens]MCP1580016.1 glycosyltransferase involved in cell wall biosynthesis [Methylorubrum extorquens]